MTLCSGSSSLQRSFWNIRLDLTCEAFQAFFESLKWMLGLNNLNSLRELIIEFQTFKMLIFSWESISFRCAAAENIPSHFLHEADQSLNLFNLEYTVCSKKIFLLENKNKLMQRREFCTITFGFWVIKTWMRLLFINERKFQIFCKMWIKASQERK